MDEYLGIETRLYKISKFFRETGKLFTNAIVQFSLPVGSV